MGLEGRARILQSLLKFCQIFLGVNITTVSYNASAVKNYNATGSLACFENKKFISYYEKRSSLLHTTLRIVIVNFEVVGLPPGTTFQHV
jgi:hypothetical protein